MSEVSITAVLAHLEVFERVYGGPLPPELFDGLPWTATDLGQKRGRVAWDDYAELVNRYGALLGNDERLDEIGDSVDRSAAWANLLLASVVSPAQVFRFWERMVPHLWRPVACQTREASGGRLEVATTLDRRRRGCRTFFRASVAAVAAMPRRIGQPDAVVEHWDVGPHHGVYVVRLPPSRTLPSRIHHRWDDLFAVFRDDGAETDRALTRLGEVEERLAEYARQLDRLAAAGREIAGASDLSALGDHLAEVATRELGYTACQVVVAGTVVGSRGTLLGPSTEHPLEHRGQGLGVLRTWGTPYYAQALKPLLPFVVAGLAQLRALEEERAVARRLEQERALLDAALARPEPMWILGPGRGVEWANPEGRARLDADPGLAERLARASPPRFRVSPVAGTPGAILVTEPDPDRDHAERLARHSAAWGLTPAQSRVLTGLARGLSNKEIAEQLGILEGTVEAHLVQVFRKAGVQQRGELVARFWST